MCAVSAKIQCPLCLTCCTKGIVCCRCGFCLPPTDQTREFNRDRFDVLSIPNYVIQKRLVRGRRCGNTDVQQLHHEAQDPLKEARKKNLTLYYRISVIRGLQRLLEKIGWTEETYPNLDRIVAEDHKIHRRRYANIWKLSLNSSGKEGSMNQRSDYAEPVRAKNRPHKEAGKESSDIPPSQRTRQRKHPSLCESTGSTVRTDPNIGWTWYSGSPSSWWHSSGQARGNASQEVLHSSSCGEW